ncbi:multicopper oxidase family protein [Paracoccus marinaquae]|uniref:Multicopper oxidase family protein n=2 Tax=Paracoccus TaxID=265 RepID=A0ABS6AQH6_9RHOB|nr:multicopper oxidase family protein [Paracoccus marinaquae]MBU3032107.1 multicopper oxidase family protein [Paracoccus marinaquae]
MTTRREFLEQGAATIAALTVPALARAATPRFAELKARPARVQLAPPTYPKTEIWGYDGAMPGPELRMAQGARIQRSFLNELPQASSVHWHGIRIDNAMDGVTGLTQPAVEPGQGFDYDFVAPDAGTYWYHAHNRSTEQVARGLYGALIVEEPEAPDIDREEVLILDDWLLDPETAQIDPDFTSRHDRSHAGRRGNFIATNGRFDLSLDVKQNERLRLRLINAANARIFVLSIFGMEGWTVALDGMPLSEPKPVSEVLIIGPGQRADLIVDVTAASGETAHLVRVEDQEGVSQVAFPVSGRAAAARRGSPHPLPPNPRMDISGMEKAVTARLNMQGGAMGTLDAATLDGERKSFRQLVDANQFWAFNGTIGMTDTPLANLSVGETLKLEIYNDTSFPHAMHLHGMHFREVTGDAGLGPFRDTLLMFGGETRTIAFVVDNPGKWLFHCHMLSHADSGMMTWLEVA